jgi:hypothetical protein
MTSEIATAFGHTCAIWHNHTAQALIDQQMMMAGVVKHAPILISRVARVNQFWYTGCRGTHPSRSFLCDSNGC